MISSSDETKRFNKLIKNNGFKQNLISFKSIVVVTYLCYCNGNNDINIATIPYGQKKKGGN